MSDKYPANTFIADKKATPNAIATAKAAGKYITLGRVSTPINDDDPDYGTIDTTIVQGSKGGIFFNITGDRRGKGEWKNTTFHGVHGTGLRVKLENAARAACKAAGFIIPDRKVAAKA